MIEKNEKQNIRLFSKEKLENWFLEQGEKKFRANQIYKWIWNKSICSFSEMSNISKPLQEKLSSNFVFKTLKEHKIQISTDGTIKSSFILEDNNFVEGVLIPSENRMTACISSQVGCSLSCKFCATGTLKIIRNLKLYEIYDQVVAIKKQCEKYYKKKLTNIVYMGMGEPLLNYNSVIDSITKITSRDGLNISAKRITVSTAGIAKQIIRLANDGIKFNLALSLHAANDAKRNKIMGINENNSLKSLVESLQYFYQKTKSKITLEYLLLKDFNDSLKDAEELIIFQKKVHSKINLIEYNTVEDLNFEKSEEKKANVFINFLKNKNIPATLRKSRGKDINAACGQLNNKYFTLIK